MIEKVEYIKSEAQTLIRVHDPDAFKEIVKTIEKAEKRNLPTCLDVLSIDFLKSDHIRYIIIATKKLKNNLTVIASERICKSLKMINLSQFINFVPPPKR